MLQINIVYQLYFENSIHSYHRDNFSDIKLKYINHMLNSTL